MAQLNFNAEGVDPNVGFEPIPAGDYTAMITESEIKPTKAGTGAYLQLVWEIVDGVYQGRKLWQRINVQNQSQQAEEIGQRQLSNICHAVNMLQVQDSAELHNRPAIVKVKFVPADGQYNAKNEITSCESLQGAVQQPQQVTQPQAVAPVATQPQPAQQQVAPAAAAAPATPPWKR